MAENTSASPKKYRKAKDFLGKTFGRLKVLEITGRDARSMPLVRCSCECGNEHVGNLWNLVDGSTTSCGCLRREILALPTPDRPPSRRKKKAYPQTPEKHRENQIKWVRENPEKVAAIAARHRTKHATKVKAEKSGWFKKNRGKINKKINERFATDPIFRIESLLRGRIRKMVRLRGAVKAESALKLVGCSLNQFHAHIESLFTEGMTWGKFMHGEIHLDHKTPVSLFDLRDPEQQRAAFRYTNHQPLWAFDNLSKNDRLPDGRRARDVRRATLARSADTPAPASPAIQPDDLPRLQ